MGSSLQVRALLDKEADEGSKVRISSRSGVFCSKKVWFCATQEGNFGSPDLSSSRDGSKLLFPHL